MGHPHDLITQEIPLATHTKGPECFARACEQRTILPWSLIVMVSKDQSLTFMDLGLCCSDSVTLALIIVLTIFKEDIGLRFLGDAIDFALLLQFAIFALLSIANQQSPFTSPTCSLKLAPPLISLAANLLLGAWHFSHASPMPMIILLLLVLLPWLASQLVKSKNKTE
ncbi:unnamed protein product [Effrenium voratum]|nr:unnamed protein product [Effrenium voratum]